MALCPCCSNQMLRHFRLQQTYWFCRYCWQEMPNLVLEDNKSFVGLSVTVESALKQPFPHLENAKSFKKPDKIMSR